MVPYLLGFSMVSQEDLPLLGDGGGSVEVHQFIDGVELLLPEVVLALFLPEDFEVQHLVSVARREAGDEAKRWGAQSTAGHFGDGLGFLHGAGVDLMASKPPAW